MVDDSNLMAGISRELVSEDQIRQRVTELGAELAEIYRGRRPLLVGVLTGAFVFMADLCRAMQIPLDVEFMAVSSYGESTQTSGVVKILKDLDSPIEGRDLLIVEDIIDSGLTLAYLLDVLERRGPRDIKVVALLMKDREYLASVRVDYCGFTIPDEFVVGYGLDVSNRYRNLSFVGVYGESVNAEK
ncbi:MAG TPA: hypoxanthine phosphoribosyltransferase [Thermomicrobiales bacterium]|nr:hypoxanthine phosphoribosyltransferase [Thermomicrobiales bacterium]HQZ88738.1 hypoxanthine phosphoribosyltransferase [Thermomicrobiales bacterium]HRA32490.1 hypoxanthine phosphoribosyltransferase [Thermomicrobiales bacterium]